MTQFMDFAIDTIKWSVIDIRGFFRDPVKETDLWVERWSGEKYELVEIESKRTPMALLTTLHMATSRTDAERLIRAGAIEFKCIWKGGVDWERLQPKQNLPIGEPLFLRRGQAFYGVKTIVIPSPEQKFLEFREIMRIDRERSYGAN